MNWSNSLPEPYLSNVKLYATEDAVDAPAMKQALRYLGHPPYRIVDSPLQIPTEHLNQTTWFITSHRGSTVNKCPGSRGHLCCNYITVDLYLGCTLGCSYCIMKSYLNFAPITIYVDPRPSIDRIRSIAKSHPDRRIRIGTGETGDSLLLDPIFDLSRDFIQGLSDLPNVQFELKTKTTNVDHLLDLANKGRAVIAFSLNASKIQSTEEGSSAPIEDRIAAAIKAAKAGYGLAFHFDPIIRFTDWEKSYAKTITLLKTIPSEQIHWISLGAVRFTPRLRDHLEDRPYLFDEFVPCKDGKYRYFKPIRIQIYRWFLQELSKITSAPIYLCMESVDVWRAVFGYHPMKNLRLRDIIKWVPPFHKEILELNQ